MASPGREQRGEAIALVTCPTVYDWLRAATSIPGHYVAADSPRDRTVGLHNQTLGVTFSIDVARIGHLPSWGLEVPHHLLKTVVGRRALATCITEGTHEFDFSDQVWARAARGPDWRSIEPG